MMLLRGVRPLLALVLCTTAACGVVRGTFSSHSTASDGQISRDHRLREWLALGWYDAAEKAVGRGGELRPDDRLLRALYAGSVSYYAGRGKRAADAFARAGDMANERFTKSASKGAMSLLANDLALPYSPGDNERLFIHYYAMLARLQAGDRSGAGVEARRLAWLLEQSDERRDSLDRETRALMRYLSGAVFEMMGDAADAEVAYRNAAALGAAGIDTSALRQPPPRDSADLIVIVERGFVAHKVEQALLIATGQDDIALFGTTTDERSRESADRVSRRILVDLSPTPLGGYEYRSRHDRWDGDVDWLKIAWPVFHRPLLPVAPVRVSAGAAEDTTLEAEAAVRAPRPAGVSPVIRADVSDAVVADYIRAAPLLMTRAVLRAGVRVAIDRALEEAAEDDEKEKKKKYTWRSFFRDAFDVTSWVMEAADTRSWHLLPGDVSVVRLRVPAGTTTVRVELPAAGDIVVDGVVAPGGSLAIRTVRSWREDDGRIRRYGEPAVADASGVPDTGRR